MESEKRYFLEGLFIIVLVAGAAFMFVWLAKAGTRDDIHYRIHFTESVSGLSVGDPVKFRGVDVGTVKTMAIDNTNANLVQVDVSLRKDAPVKTDTKASLKLKGFTGNLIVELNGGTAKAKSLVEATPAGQIPEIPSEVSKLTTVLDALPKVIEKFTAMETKAGKMMSDVGAVTGTLKQAAENAKEATEQVKDDPSVLLWGNKNKKKDKEKEEKERK